MGFELENVLYETEDFLRRTLRSSASREARKRRAKRKFEEALRRVRRATLIFVGLMAALVAAAIAVGGIGFLTWLVAIPTAILFALISLSWPSRRQESAPSAPGMPKALPLPELALRVEDGLIDRSKEFPGRALPAADAIVARLNELQPHLADLAPNSLPAGNARRLIGEHLPKLIDSYLELPPTLRRPGSESSERFTESLDIVARELDELLETCCRDKQLGFDTQQRFIETRYKDDPDLSGQ